MTAGVSWIHGCTRNHTNAVNMVVIARAKGWVEEILGVTTVLVIERQDDRNRATFRFALQGGMGEVDVKEVFPLLRQRRSLAWRTEQLMAIVKAAA